MNRVFHSWHSPRLNRTMELLEFGHAGMPVLVFPTSLGKFYEYEDRGMVSALSAKIEAGYLHLYCVDSVDAESWYNKQAAPWDKIRRHNEYEAYLLHEVLPLMGGGRIGVTGCSFGGYHAVNFALRHPDVVSHCVSMGGAYDLTSFLGDYRGEDFYFHQPLMYLPQDDDGWYWERYRELTLILATGENDICRRDNERLSEVLSRRSIPHRLDIWDNGTGHDWPWWQQMARTYF
ncbi:esterase family protein [Armatimonas rosea]|uniref:Esterase/lipase superfamily enzyme n=1 Tax=Armatimonas rosea TaxID=685828 RepID=A0A7W9SSH1_ARMRO|nr:alpha/beta fold hydrolase [Armatimonas rosea]MBB6052032.1 esterase/lipase superfamily enzyme [Armatimonas rosea]